MGRDVAAPDAGARILQGIAHVLLLGCCLLGLLMLHLHPAAMLPHLLQCVAARKRPCMYISCPPALRWV